MFRLILHRWCLFWTCYAVLSRLERESLNTWYDSCCRKERWTVQCKSGMFFSNPRIMSRTFAQMHWFLVEIPCGTGAIGLLYLPRIYREPRARAAFWGLVLLMISDHVMNQIKAAKLTSLAKNECLTCEWLSKFLHNIATTYTMVRHLKIVLWWPLTWEKKRWRRKVWRSGRLRHPMEGEIFIA